MSTRNSSTKLFWIFFYLIGHYYFTICALEAPTVHLPNQGVILGTYLKMFRTQNIKAYLGIQYAKAPRFAPPEIKVNKWNMVYNATSFGPKCWQKSIRSLDKTTIQILELLMISPMRDISGNEFDEECLYLNIFIPDGSPGVNGYAVMVWFHGGDFSSGSPTDIDPFQMVFKQKVIVITVAYRLSIFGFFTTGDGEAPGNYALMDQSAALLWIRKNIAHFGGDSKQITIVGHSAGAISAGLHLTSGDWSRNAFHKVIMMSGNPLTEDTVKTMDYYLPHLDSIANTFGCNRKPTSMLLQCLKRNKPETIMNLISTDIEWGPVMDKGFSNNSKGFIEDFPVMLLKSGNYHKVPVMVGITDMEDVLQILDDEEENGGVQMTSESFDTFVSKVAMDDIHKTNQTDLWCTDYPIVLDSINLMYKNEDNVNHETIINNFISFHTDRMHLAPLFLLSNLVSSDEDVYVYYFNIRPKTEFYTLPPWINVPKYFDQIFIWGVPYMNNNMFISRWNSTDKKISDIVMTLWANFAKTSNPTSFNIYLKWNSYNVNNQSYLIINEDFNLKTVSENHKINYWNDFYPKLIDFAIECCSSRNNGNTIQKMVSSKGLYLVAIIFYLIILLLN